MKPKLYCNFLYFLINIIQFLFLFLFLYIIGYLYNYSNTSVEPFYVKGFKIDIDSPPKLKEAYRPYLRKARLYSENYFNDTNNYVNKFLRKTGLY